MHTFVIKNKLCFLVFIIVNLLSPFTTFIHADIDKGTIKGRIMDVTTKLPLEGVNVFLANTSLGDVSGKNGIYEIRNISLGSYTLVVSMMGYEVEKTEIVLLQKEIIKDFQLIPKILRFKPLEISAEKLPDWNKHLKKFKRLFIGTSQFAGKCEILNPELLDFSETDGSFAAKADGPLEINNPAFGYKIRFILEAFKLADDELSYMGQTQFIEQHPRSEKELLQWQKNRKTAYMGSPRHFLASVLKNNLASEGFIVHQLAKKPKAIKKNVPGIITETPIKIEKGILPFERVLSFPGRLQVEYTRERVEGEYTGGEFQISWIEMTRASVISDSLGNLLYRQAIKQYGYWGWKRFGDLLPTDYIPESSRFFSAITTPALDSLEQLLDSKSYNKIPGELIVNVLDELVFKKSDQKKVIKQLRTDIVDIMSDKEVKNWKLLKTNLEKAQYLKKFWLLRDMSFGTKKNERLEEHYERLQFARSIYSALTPARYDDRGRIYVKYGKPEARQVDVMPNYQNMGSATIGEVVAGRSLETWIYPLTGDQIIFNFVDKGWGYSLAYLSEDILPYWMEPKSGRRFIVFSEIIRLRVDLDVRFASANAQGSGEGAFDTILREETIEQQKLPITISSQFEDISELEFSYKPALFENNKNEHILALAYGFREDDVKFATSAEKEQQEIKILSLIRDQNFNDIALAENTLLTKPDRFDETGELIYQIQIPLTTNKFYIIAAVNNPLGKQKGFKDYGIQFPVFTDQQLHLSSVIFAKTIIPFDKQKKTEDSSVLVRNNLAIRMYPFLRLRGQEPIFIYFEMYGLKKDKSGDTRYEIEYTVDPVKKKGLIGFFANLNPFKKDNAKISISSSHEGKKVNDYFSIKLDISQLKSGNYDLVVRITDKIVNNSKETKTSFILR